MTQYYLGADLGATKIHVIIADEQGIVKSFSEGGPGNHESVGYERFQSNLQEAVKEALNTANLSASQISGSGFGIAGYDWPSEREPMLQVLNTLHLGGKIELVNDAELGLVVGSPRGWGVTVVSGTGCNARGWDATRTRFGRVTGGGISCGEFAGASELMFKTAHAIAYDWTGRGPHTALSQVFVEKCGARDLEELLQDVITGKIEINPADARLVFQVASQGDPVAIELIQWAGHELGELGNAVIRQLEFETVDFDLVMIGSMFDGGPLMIEAMKETVLALAPKARFIRAAEPPVIGAVLLGMQVAGIQDSSSLRKNLIETLALIQKDTE